jgi:hypothetical protein
VVGLFGVVVKVGRVPGGRLSFEDERKFGFGFVRFGLRVDVWLSAPACLDVGGFWGFVGLK